MKIRLERGNNTRARAGARTGLNKHALDEPRHELERRRDLVPCAVLRLRDIHGGDDARRDEVEVPVGEVLARAESVRRGRAVSVRLHRRRAVSVRSDRAISVVSHRDCENEVFSAL